MFTVSPLTQKKIKAFKNIKRGYWSFIVLATLLVLSLFAELLVNSKALIVKYQGDWFFPVISDVRSGIDFGLDYASEADYRVLQKKFAQADEGNFVLMPIVPWNPYEQDFSGDFPPTAPNAETKHYLGTDVIGRDILARLVYGFRTAMGFALVTMAISYAIGTVVGCAMGFFGGKFDLFVQRLIEIWSMVPFLYVIMILVSITQPTFVLFVAINVLFGWMGMTWYMRTMTYKESAREYVMAAKALGASTMRILLHHILPNTMVMIVTLAPFTIAGNITALTALDYLGLGLMPPTPSWGELLQQGKSNLDSPWIVSSVVTSIVAVLVMVTFIGEAIRAAFDPKKFTRYV
ncbi:ABC transporter permease subunit [Vibrio vulnificus]|uniref:ABC transporter permease n=1 Tax=Vibrio vulnificus TaxID=672 RepID=UPI000CD29A7C|nr:ABC transporter permease subunit [Vibrio vulnificus]EGQ7936363.1 ABC transporter permease subunit [Vibrio vulnificus]EGR0101574.1 ABC transporter permease subunit [Vibrio vulnificus]EGS1997057.1 ABC transporter permease subunit [Vibrio vulnificus]EHD2236415.1 ABC transporter permease subunit [Vibrio vulnificus]EHD2250570.1 ABC transporter permease subunit [Vibrio vulnificus]